MNLITATQKSKMKKDKTEAEAAREAKRETGTNNNNQRMTFDPWTLEIRKARAQQHASARNNGRQSSKMTRLRPSSSRALP
jgi:hypothetical protein